MFRKQYKGKLYQIKTEQLDLAITPEHRVLSWSYRNKKPEERTAFELANIGQRYIPLSGTLNGELEYPAWVSMLMADFSKESTGWRGEFTKQRKIDRFLKLAE